VIGFVSSAVGAILGMKRKPSGLQKRGRVESGRKTGSTLDAGFDPGA